MAHLGLTNLHKSFGAVEVIKGLDLEIWDGEFVVFVGPSGCGKSTTLRMIAGLEDVTSGSITVDGQDVTHTKPSAREIAMVFQSYALFPHMTVGENIGFGLKLRKTNRREMKSLIDKVAETLQLTPLLDRLPRELSGGQRQRVAIGRAIIRNPKIFLFDEPLSNLDAALRVQMRLEIARLHKKLGNTMVYVTHDQVEAMTLADRIAVFNAGVIEQVGTPMDLYERPSNRFVAGFIGAPCMNFFAAKVNGTDVEIAGMTSLPRPPIARDITEIGIRPEHLKLCNPVDAAFRGEIELVERLGAESFAYVRVSGQKDNLTVRLPGEAGLHTGSQIGVELDQSRIHWFDGAGDALR